MDYYIGQQKTLKTGIEVKEYYFVKWVNPPDKKQKKDLENILSTVSTSPLVSKRHISKDWIPAYAGMTTWNGGLLGGRSVALPPNRKCEFTSRVASINRKETTSTGPSRERSSVARVRGNIKPDFLVVPRIGTISSWSSKATDILTVSGVVGLNRIEKGLGYFLGNNKDIDRSHYFDRMTETVIANINDANALFDESPKSQEKKYYYLKMER